MNLPLEELYISQAQCDQIKAFGSEREVQLFLAQIVGTLSLLLDWVRLCC